MLSGLRGRNYSLWVHQLSDHRDEDCYRKCPQHPMEAASHAGLVAWSLLGLGPPLRPMLWLLGTGGGKGWQGSTGQRSVHGVWPTHALCPLLPLAAEALGLFLIQVDILYTLVLFSRHAIALASHNVCPVVQVVADGQLLQP